MEKRILQRQLIESSIYYASERRRVRKMRTNVVLVFMIVGVCVSTRFMSQSTVSEVNESTRRHNLGMPPHQLTSKFDRTQIA